MQINFAALVYLVPILLLVLAIVPGGPKIEKWLGKLRLPHRLGLGALGVGGLVVAFLWLNGLAPMMDGVPPNAPEPLVSRGGETVGAVRRAGYAVAAPFSATGVVDSWYYGDEIELADFGIVVEGGEAVSDLAPDGRFEIDLLEDRGTSVSWIARRPTAFVIWPLELEASDGEVLRFCVRRLNDVLVAQRNEMERLVLEGNYEGANRELERVLGLVSGETSDVSRWRYTLHRDLSTAASQYRPSVQYLLDDARLRREREWHRGAIVNSLGPRTLARAANAWAGFSREAFRPGRRHWPDCSLTSCTAGLLRSSDDDIDYRGWLREDLQLLVEKLDSDAVRQLAAREVNGCRSEDAKNSELATLLARVLEDGEERASLSGIAHLLTELQAVADACGPAG